MIDEAPSTIVSARKGRGPESGDVRSRVPAITIMWHPNPERIGRISALTPGRTEVSRFTSPFDPLTDVVLSRSPFLLVDHREGAVVLRTVATKTSIAVDGVPLAEPRQVSQEELRRGVLITLADKIVVCLHQLRTPVLRGPKQGMVGTSDIIEDVRRQIEKVASVSVPVFIQGESGTGKELVARAIAAGSSAPEPFVAVNMANVPATLATTMLFGHEKSSFTGATEAHPGYFAQADGGTLFLDEIDAAQLDVQKMLLRVLESGEISPLGSRKNRKVKVRLLFATDKDLESAVDRDAFDGALLHRINEAYRISLPPLRERREDVGSLFLHFVREELIEAAEVDRLQPLGIDERPWLDASDFVRIALSPFPGNIRTLKRIARRVVVCSRGQPYAKLDADVEQLLSPMDLPPAARTDSQRVAGETARVRRSGQPTDAQVTAALRQHNYNFSAAAAELGIHRNTLYERVRGNPGSVRAAESVTDDEVLQAYDRHQGDIVKMAADLHVSPKPLKNRVVGVLRRQRPR